MSLQQTDSIISDQKEVTFPQGVSSASVKVLVNFLQNGDQILAINNLYREELFCFTVSCGLVLATGTCGRSRSLPLGRPLAVMGSART